MDEWIPVGLLPLAISAVSLQQKRMARLVSAALRVHGLCCFRAPLVQRSMLESAKDWIPVGLLPLAIFAGTHLSSSE